MALNNTVNLLKRHREAIIFLNHCNNHNLLAKYFAPIDSNRTTEYETLKITTKWTQTAPQIDSNMLLQMNVKMTPIPT